MVRMYTERKRRTAAFRSLNAFSHSTFCNTSSNHATTLVTSSSVL